MDSQSVSQPGSIPLPVSVPPENPSYRYAGFERRLVALLIDSMIIGSVNGVISVVFFLIGRFMPNTLMTTILSSMGSLIQIVLSIGYNVYFIGTTGQTIGKKLLGIRVVSQLTGQSISYGQAFLRETIGKFVSSFLCLGYLWALWDQEKQTWHDKIANTVVIKI